MELTVMFSWYPAGNVELAEIPLPGLVPPTSCRSHFCILLQALQYHLTMSEPHLSKKYRSFKSVLHSSLFVHWALPSTTFLMHNYLRDWETSLNNLMVLWKRWQLKNVQEFSNFSIFPISHCSFSSPRGTPRDITPILMKDSSYFIIHWLCKCYLRSFFGVPQLSVKWQPPHQ